MSGWMVLHLWASQIISISQFAFFTCLGRILTASMKNNWEELVHSALYLMSLSLLEFKTRRKLAGRSESLPSVDERSKNDQEVHLAFGQMIGFYRLGFYRLLVAFRATLSASRRAEQRENCLISHPGHVWWRLLSGRVDLAASSSHVLSQNQIPNEGPKIQFSSMDSTSPAKVRQHAPSPLSAGVLLHYAPLFATIIASISVYYRICVCFSRAQSWT